MSYWETELIFINTQDRQYYAYIRCFIRLLICQTDELCISSRKVFISVLLIVLGNHTKFSKLFRIWIYRVLRPRTEKAHVRCETLKHNLEISPVAISDSTQKTSRKIRTRPTSEWKKGEENILQNSDKQIIFENFSLSRLCCCCIVWV